MIVTFHIEYRTSWGEEVRILGSVPELGKNNPEQAVALTTVDGIHWSNEISIQLPAEGVVEYSYHIYRDGKAIRTEWNSFPRRIYLPADVKEKPAHQRLLEESSGAAILLQFGIYRSTAGAPRTKRNPQKLQKGLMIKAYAPRINSKVLPGHLW